MSKISISKKYCTACHTVITKEIIHPLLYVPICESCSDNYNEGEFIIEDGNEIYCRFCGEGENGLYLCDTCPKSFCGRCIENALGIIELRRIQSLSDRWNCFICSPQIIHDLCIKNNWKTIETSSLTTSALVTSNHYNYELHKKKMQRKGIIHTDISNGREKFEIPVYNDVDNEKAPNDFVYITNSVAGVNVKLSNNPNLLGCCTCNDNCRDPTTCQCAILTGGIAYDVQGNLLSDRPGGIYECNSRCQCNKNRCKNRVVGNGPQLRLEVFRCDNPIKGWGLRCKSDIYAGTYIADYIGEIILEADADRIGLTYSDEYLFTMDFWGRTRACQTLIDLGFKTSISKIPRDVDMDAALMSKEYLEIYLDKELIDILNQKGIIQRGNENKKRLRENPEQYMLLQDIEYGNQPNINILGSNSNDTNSINNTMNSSINNNTNEVILCKETYNYKNKKNIIPLKSNTTTSNIITATTSSRNKSNTNNSNPTTNSNNSSLNNNNYKNKSWIEIQKLSRQKSLEQAQSIIQDRIIIETEENNETYAIDAKWYGNVGRFINHSCTPNLDRISVFCESHDIRRPRVAFVANDYIKANTELCYDYGYLAGNVEGKHRLCLCGSDNCRKILY